ncbi:MAG: hypothetical protein V4631_22095 [Pseudomonadota bacterium]
MQLETVQPHRDVTPAMRALMHVDPDTNLITFHHDGADPALVRAFIRQMADDLNALPGALGGLPIKQMTHDGMVCRAMMIPKGMLLVGKIHKLDCINIVAKGAINLMTEHGSGRMVAGEQAISPAGTQKIGFATEDTVFINIFRCDEVSIEGIDAAIAWPSFEAFDAAQLITHKEG